MYIHVHFKDAYNARYCMYMDKHVHIGTINDTDI